MDEREDGDLVEMERMVWTTTRRDMEMEMGEVQLLRWSWISGDGLAVVAEVAR